mmetsp:Transcript_6063/g.25079  ORF Transcript_6063/g.25079 Transcript_6063/m.25079 type:complete len:236 (+) Transcript_6063:123-830(+)
MFRACPSRWWTACRASSPETATATWWRGTCARGARCGAYPRTRHPPERSTRNSRRARPRACSRKGATAPSSVGEPPSAAAAIRGRPRAPRRAGPYPPDPTTTASSRRGSRPGTTGRERSSPSPGRRSPPWTSARCRRLTTRTTRTTGATRWTRPDGRSAWTSPTAAAAPTFRRFRRRRPRRRRMRRRRRRSRSPRARRRTRWRGVGSELRGGRRRKRSRARRASRGKRSRRWRGR